MIFEQLNPGPCRTYLAASEKTREAVLIDPVLDRVEDYLKVLEQGNWRLGFIVDTHTHADHISGGMALRDHTQAPFAMHHLARPYCPTHRVNDGDVLGAGDVQFKCLYTPGHTNDSMTLVFEDRLFTGDFLFIGEAGAGRTDLPTGDPGEHFEPELPISSCLGPSNAPSSTRAIVVSVTDAVNHPIKRTKPSLGVVS